MMRREVTLTDFTTYLKGIQLPVSVTGIITPVQCPAGLAHVETPLYLFERTDQTDDVFNMLPFLTFRIHEFLPPTVGAMKGMLLLGLHARGGKVSLVTYGEATATFGGFTGESQ
jgi:hypothetical protein